MIPMLLEFLSTPSARRATPASCRRPHLHPISIHALREEGDLFWHISDVAQIDFYPRPPRGGRRLAVVLLKQLGQISIHALREEGDCQTRSYEDKNGQFLSTPSARRATYRKHKEVQHGTISIHALREEGDPICWKC